MKKNLFIIVSLVIFVLTTSACSSTATSTTSSTDDTDDSDSNSAALVYADYGENLSNAMSSGLKVGGVNASVSLFLNTLSGDCATDYTDCPNITEVGGGDSSAAEILMRLWGLDYDEECTDAFLTDGTCFTCEDCETGITSNFIKPTLLSDPTECGTTSTTSARYINFGIDPCYFDTIIAGISNIAECETVSGGEVDISAAVPWYASWDIPQTINFSSYHSTSAGGIWWTVNNGASRDDQYFFSLDTDWLYAGMKNPTDDQFLFFGTGSPDYYNGRGEGNGVNISAYTGTLSAIPATFEAIQVRVQDPNNYVERLTSNGSYLWFQYWSGDDFPATAADIDAIKDDPSENRCVLIGDSIVLSKYVPLSDCVSSFEKSSVVELNQESNYTLKMIDGETANSIDFSTPLTSTTATSCLEETTTE